MKISLNWLKQYIDTDLSPERIGEILTGTGLEVEGMEMVQSLPGGLQGVVVGEVVECGKHPDADRLSLTRVNVGRGEPLQIVCGAPNVAAGQKVMVATVGTELHPLEGEPFTIKKGKIRGKTSEGMICAEDELGLGSDHEGIIVLPEETPVGLQAADYYKVETDYVYEIGLTPNRSDATNHLGVAFDLAAALRINHDGTGEVKQPSVEDFRIGHTGLNIPVEVRDPQACPRYSGVTIEGLQVGESPEWLKRRLRAVGVRPINNVVDITNYVLHELGQPLHAFDLDKMDSQGIIVETKPAGTRFTTLDEEERELTGHDLMICDAAGNPLCIGGVFGGIGSGVTGATTRIFLESAHFESTHIRRTSMHHNLRTDAAKVFEKGSDPNITVYALKRAALLMQELAGGRVASDIVDLYPNPVAPTRIRVRYGRINDLIGQDIPREQVHAILQAMNMTISDAGEEAFTVAVPTNKTDVTREVDIIEEVLRIYGFNNVPLHNKVSSSMAIAPDPDPIRIRELIGDLLAASGYREMMALSLDESRHYDAGSLAIEPAERVYINNTSNVHLDIMRPHMLYSALGAVVHNQNRQQSDLRLFEFGRSYRRDGDQYRETNHLTLTVTGRRHPESWLASDDAWSFHGLKGTVQQVLARLGIESYQVSDEVDGQGLAYGLRYHRGPQELVRFGRVAGGEAKAWDIRGEVFFADFNWDNLLRALPRQRVQFSGINKYPSVRRDLALVVDKSVKFQDIAAIGAKTGKKLLSSVNLFDVYENEEQLGAGKKSYAVSFVFEDPDKTLQDKDIDKVMSKLIQQFETQLDARIRR